MPPVIAAIGAVVGTIGTAVASVVVGSVAAAGLSAAITIGIGALAIGGLALISSALKPKPPPARGSVTQVNLDPNAPQPYVMGEGLVGGALRHDVAYGATLSGVPNPYRLMVIDYCGGGPIEEITPYVDQAAITSYYTGFLYTSTQLGATPEAAPLALTFAGAPGWDSTSKLSGQAAIAWNAKFDKNGKVFASGLPQMGAYGKWVKVYDPRLDDTFPGGSGPCRLGDETTYIWSERPALHAGTYAYGRYQNGKRVLGVGLPADGIDWDNIAAWANVCDANDWKLFGIVYEPDDRMRNLKDIAAAGGGVPLISRGKLSFHFQTPRIALDTITEADLTDADSSVTAMTSWRDRINTIVPKYISPDHNWQLIAADAVSVATLVAEDGEVKQSEWPFNFVKDANQAAQLARYIIEDRRELQPIEITVHPRLRMLRPGDCVDLDLPSLELDTPAVILHREFDPDKMTVKLVLMGETNAKHAFALGETTTPPPTPALGQTSEERDALALQAAKPAGWESLAIRQSVIKNPRDAGDVPRNLLIASDAGSDVTIDIARHDWDYPDGQADVTRPLGTITGLNYSTLYYVYFDDETLADTTPSYGATSDPAEALNSTAYPYRHSLGAVLTPLVLAADQGGGYNPGYGFDLSVWLP